MLPSVWQEDRGPACWICRLLMKLRQLDFVQISLEDLEHFLFQAENIILEEDQNRSEMQKI